MMTLHRETPIGFIGLGRLGGSLARALDRAGYSVVAGYRRTREHRSAEDAIRGCAVVESPQAVVDAAQVVFVTTPDDAISSVSHSVNWRSDHVAIHCSGASELDPLQVAADSGAAVGSLHPLQTFPTDHSDDQLAGVTFAVESESPQLREWLDEVVHALGGRSLFLPPGARAAYHASAVMACGLMAGLVGLAAEMWESFGWSRADALEALSPLVTSTAEQIRDLGLPAALTGPLVRGDLETLTKHLAATQAKGEAIRDAYAALARAELPLAAEQGRITASQRAEMERLFARGLNGAKRFATRPVD